MTVNSFTQNFVWASPNGSAGAPSMRALVAADIPALAYDASGAAATAQSNAEAYASNASNLTSGIVASGRISGSYSGLTLSSSQITTALGYTPFSSSGGTINGLIATSGSSNGYAFFDRVNTSQEWEILATGGNFELFSFAEGPLVSVNYTTGATTLVGSLISTGSSSNVQHNYSTESALGGVYMWQAVGGSGHFTQNLKLSAGTSVATQTSGALVGFNNNLFQFTQYGGLQFQPITVSQLLSASTYIGSTNVVSDSTLAYTSANIGTPVVGGGSHYCRVFSNGTNWVIG